MVQKKVLVHFRLDPFLHKDLVDLSKHDNLTRTRIIEEGLRLYFDKPFNRRVLTKLRNNRKQAV